MNKRKKEEKENVPVKQPLSPLAYAIISFVAFIIGIILLMVFILKDGQSVVQGIDEKVFYILLLPMGFSAAAFLFGAMHSYARYKGKVFSGTLELGGPVVLFLLVIFLGFNLVPDTSPFDFTIYLRDDTGKFLIERPGKINMRVANESKLGEINKNGEVNFKNIPAKFKNSEVLIEIEAFGWQFTNGKMSTICNLKGNNATIIIKRDDSRSTISGSVTDSDGNFIVGARVIVKGIITKTNENGWFILKIPPEKQQKEQKLFANKEGYKVWEGFVVPETKKEVEIVLERVK